MWINQCQLIGIWNSQYKLTGFPTNQLIDWNPMSNYANFTNDWMNSNY